MRIADDGEAADARNILRRSADTAALRLGQRSGGVAIVNGDVTRPVRRHALAHERGWQRHHAGDPDGPRLPRQAGSKTV